MLFTDPFFLKIYLPVVLGASLLAIAVRPALFRPVLVAASLYFYACFNPADVILLIGSIGGNFLIAGRILADPARSKALMILGVSANLALLAYFKYLGFFGELLDAITGLGLPPLHILLPLGISFFTFTQLAYLVDCQRGIVPLSQHNLTDYILFVTFFPHLVAGPILHHAEMMPQFDARPSAKERTVLFGEGVVLFAVGLFKKLVIADTIAPFADQMFGLAEAGQAMSPASAWIGALSYALQIYFDFSGYSDMAVGLGLMFGIRLPWNFASPYKAANITVFWRNWHMTLSRWLRDYLYIPLGGNRHGAWRRYRNLFLTMLLGGLWHGASLNFVIWGALHGGFLVVHNLWMALTKARGAAPRGAEGEVRLAAVLAWALTMTCVLVAWVFFRAPTTDGALTLLGAMAGLGQGDAVPVPTGQAVMIALASLIAVLAPNSCQISGWTRAALAPGLGALALRIGLGLGTGGALVASAIAALRVTQSPFLYFNF